MVVTVSFACFALSFVSHPVERSITDLKMLIRGSQPPDSTLFILYLDNFDISNLGGYPVSRLHIASAVHALSTLNVAVVGIDLLFEKENLAYPEYDLLLAEQITQAGNVILGMYFQKTSPTGSGVPAATEPIYPHRLFRESAAGIGSSNFFLTGVTRSMPLFFETQVDGAYRWMPVLALRMLWQYKCRQALEETDSTDMMNPALAASWLETCQGTSAGKPVRLNFRGTQRSYIMIPFVSFMKSYDSLAQGYDVHFPFRALRGKVALIGVAAESRSPFVSTPFSRAFPALALHAVLFDTLLHGSQIRDTPWWLALLIIVLAALGGAYIRPFARLKNLLIAVAVFSAYLAAVEGAFILYFWDLPVVMPLLAFGLTALGTVLVRSRERSSYIASLERERKELHQELSRRTLELENTRREILQSSEDIPPSVEARIQEYEREIARLRLRINDVVVAEEQRQIVEPRMEFAGMVYHAEGPMAAVVKQIRSVAPNDVTVLLTGESGTGKELVARAIHKLSKRKDKPFIAVNCGALTETLLESELFGYEKGAFTGAAQRTPGRFERADGGTLFLDEIAETSEAFQVKLLRVLQEGEFERVGGRETMRIDVRVIAATNRDLQEMIEQKKFREDLFYRLNILPIHLPPLRERRQDIPLITEHLLRRENPGIRISRTALAALVQHQWRGNIRELESIIKRVVILCTSEGRNLIRLGDLPEDISRGLRIQEELDVLILEVLRQKQFSRGAMSETAADLGGLDRSTVMEYFRGVVFQQFVADDFDLERTVASLAATNDEDVKNNVRSKVREYVSNLVKDIDPSNEASVVLARLRTKYKNMPRKFHPALETLVRSYIDSPGSFRGLR